jgi:hypothetical protein
MPTTRLTDVYIDPRFRPTEGPPIDLSIRGEARLTVLRRHADKSPAHRARYDAARAELAETFAVARIAS